MTCSTVESRCPIHGSRRRWEFLSVASGRVEHVAQVVGLDAPPLVLLLEDTPREKLLEEIVAKYGDVRLHTYQLGDLAKSLLFEIRNLSIGKPAPEIIGEDIDGKPMKLSDYRGKVVVLDFWGFW